MCVCLCVCVRSRVCVCALVCVSVGVHVPLKRCYTAALIGYIFVISCDVIDLLNRHAHGYVS